MSSNKSFTKIKDGEGIIKLISNVLKIPYEQDFLHKEIDKFSGALFQEKYGVYIRLKWYFYYICKWWPGSFM